MSAKWYKERLDDVGKTINQEDENENKDKWKRCKTFS